MEEEFKNLNSFKEGLAMLPCVLVTSPGKSLQTFQAPFSWMTKGNVENAIHNT